MSVPRHNAGLTAEEIRNLVGTKPFIIEVGCNDGRDTLAFLRAMPGARIIAFDPEPRAASHFLCHHDERVEFIATAISHKHETRRLWQSGGIPDCTDKHEEWYQSGSILAPTGHLKRSPEIRFSEGPMVQCRPLDFYLDRYRLPVDFLWCDAQGAEARVILGGYRTLMQTRYAIFEYYDSPLYENQADLKALVSFLPDFTLLGIYGENALFANKTLL